MPVLEDLPPDTALSLRTAAAALAHEFGDVLAGGTIESFLVSSYEQLAAGARINAYLPLMAEKFARQRLRALIKVEQGTTSNRPAVLFLCVHNAGRSQMALGWFNHLAGDRATAWSGGSEPGTEVNPAAVAAMAEVGIDITQEFPKPWTSEIVQAADVVVTMGCGDSCPVFPCTRYEDWDLDDPAGQGIDAVRSIRDDIKKRVSGLLASLDAPVS